MENLSFQVFRSGYLLLALAFQILLIWNFCFRKEKVSSFGVEWMIAGAVFLFYTFVTGAGSSVLKESHLDRNAIFLSIGVQTLLFSLLLWRIWKTNRGRSLGLRLKEFLPHWKLPFIILFSMWIFLIFFFLSLNFFFPDWHINSATQESITAIKESKDTSLIFLICFAALFIAPIQEELIFRGYLFPSLSTLGGKVFAALFTSILFALSHLNLPILFPLFFFGLLLAFSYQRSQTILVPILAHFLFNFVSVLYHLLSRYSSSSI